MTPQMLAPAKPTGFKGEPKLELLEVEVERFNSLESTISSLMEQLNGANEECADLNSELFTTRAQVGTCLFDCLFVCLFVYSTVCLLV